ncbi:MAG: NUDIX hydrolase [Parasporobacterium sp.]|nr:NUDIX hydrolase [Parasporobacterium sp.]
MKEFNDLTEKQLASREVFAGKIMNVLVDDIELPDGHTATREYISHCGAVCVVPVTEDGKVVMERQYRYPIRRVVREIPAGKLDGRNEDHLEAAKRELKEETGITADNWHSLGRYVPAPAYSEEDIDMYLATGLHYGEQKLDDEEFLCVYEEPIESLVEDILAGRISDGKTQIAILKAYKILKGTL